mmetsp:Transcript_5560/g.23499  ORF Transcript_5560/g.23499 Transcript_5560/m.23499 type:complete len:229 (+) Transcript_5560:417-1103(+)
MEQTRLHEIFVRQALARSPSRLRLQVGDGPPARSDGAILLDESTKLLVVRGVLVRPLRFTHGDHDARHLAPAVHEAAHVEPLLVVQVARLLLRESLARRLVGDAAPQFRAHVRLQKFLDGVRHHALLLEVLLVQHVARDAVEHRHLAVDAGETLRRRRDALRPLRDDGFHAKLVVQKRKHVLAHRLARLLVSRLPRVVRHLRGDDLLHHLAELLQRPGAGGRDGRRRN